MRSKVGKYIKILPGFVTLLGLFLVTTITNKIQINDSKTVLKEEENKKMSSDKKQRLAKADDTSHLFVDCTGFFE